MAPAPNPPRRTQAERRDTTRAAILDATIKAWSSTATPARPEAVRHVAELRADKIQEALERLPQGRERVLAALDLLSRVHAGSLFEASLELWVAARTDPELAELSPNELSRVWRGSHPGGLRYAGGRATIRP